MGIATSCIITMLYFIELCHKSKYYLKCLIALPLPAELGYCSSSSVWAGLQWSCVEISRSVSCCESVAVRTVGYSILTMVHIYYSIVSVCHKGDGEQKFMHSLTIVFSYQILLRQTSCSSLCIRQTKSFPRRVGKTSNRRKMYTRSSANPSQQLQTFKLKFEE